MSTANRSSLLTEAGIEFQTVGQNNRNPAVQKLLCLMIAGAGLHEKQLDYEPHFLTVPLSDTSAANILEAFDEVTCMSTVLSCVPAVAGTAV